MKNRFIVVPTPGGLYKASHVVTDQPEFYNGYKLYETKGDAEVARLEKQRIATLPQKEKRNFLRLRKKTTGGANA